MGWKNWPYWLKGGVIGIILGILWSLITPITYIKCLIENNWDAECGFELFILNPVAFLILSLFSLLILFFYESGISEDTSINTSIDIIKALSLPIFILFINIILGFLLGALIGWLYGKFKAK